MPAKRYRKKKYINDRGPLNEDNLFFNDIRTQKKHDGVWYVRNMPAKRAIKIYLCPNCKTNIQPQEAHLVSWKADGLLGDSVELTSRRHWHFQCWKMKN